MKVTDEEYTFPMHGTFSGFYILNVCLVSGEQKAFKVYKNKWVFTFKDQERRALKKTLKQAWYKIFIVKVK